MSHVDKAETPANITRHAYTINETVLSVGLSRDLIDGAISDKKLVATIVTPRKKVIRPADVEAWLDSLPRTA